jgi:hypothetical protein
MSIMKTTTNTVISFPFDNNNTFMKFIFVEQ